MGHPFESFAGRVGVTRRTLYNWIEKHPEFAESKEISREHARLFHIDLGIKAMSGEIPNFMVVPWIFFMKNCFGWRDKVEAETSLEITTAKKIVASKKDLIESAKKIRDERAKPKSKS